MDDRGQQEQVERIFHAALDCDQESRAVLLRKECGDDEELRRRVESLLAWDRDTSLIDRSLTGEGSGKSLGRYRLLSKLGEGGMGTVYLARDTGLNRDVALKILPSLFASDPERRRRFLREARAASALSHPNIVPVYDFGREGEVDYYVMEYVRGKPLDRLIPRTGLKPGEALAYAADIASALQAAHQAGIIHRDIKPGNVIVDETGAAKVLDFGIAKIAPPAQTSGDSPRSTETGTGMIVGTCAYMSPEQAEGLPVDARSDIFSFGSLLYEMVTGRRAFEQSSAASTLSSILRDTPPRADSLVSDIPADLCQVLDRCLQKDPAQRYQSMAAVLTALDHVRAHLGRPAQGSKPFRWYWPAAALAVLGALTALLIFKPHDQQNLKSSITQAPDVNLRVVPVTSDPGEEAYPSFSPDGNQITFTHRPPGEATSHIFVKLIGQNGAVQLTKGSKADLCPAWSPDGRWIAFLRYAGPLAFGFPMGTGFQLMLIPAIGGPERKLADVDVSEGVDRVSWHPGGKWMAVVDRDTNCGCDAIKLISTASGEKHLLLAPESRSYQTSPAFSSDGKRMVFTRVNENANEDLYLLDLNEDLTAINPPRRLTFNNIYARNTAWMPDGRSVVYSFGNQLHVLSRVWIQPSGSEPRIPQLVWGATATVSAPTVSSNGRVAFSTTTFDADIWRVELTGSPSGPGRTDRERRWIASTRLDHTVEFSPDGKRLAFASGRSGSDEIWVSNAEGNDAMQLTSFEGPYTASPHWSPDGQSISFSSQAGGSWAVYTVPSQGGSLKRLTDPRLAAQGGSWTPDGQWVYCATGGQLWKVPSAGGNPIQITRRGGSVPAQTFDGRTIYYLHDETPVTSLWAVPAEGGEERQVLPVIFSQNFVTRKDGIYYIPGPEKPGIWFFRFADHKSAVVTLINGQAAYGMDVSKDGRFALVPQYEDKGGDIMMIENLR